MVNRHFVWQETGRSSWSTWCHRLRPYQKWEKLWQIRWWWQLFVIMLCFVQPLGSHLAGFSKLSISANNPNKWWRWSSLSDACGTSNWSSWRWRASCAKPWAGVTAGVTGPLASPEGGVGSGAASNWSSSFPWGFSGSHSPNSFHCCRSLAIRSNKSLTFSSWVRGAWLMVFLF